VLGCVGKQTKETLFEQNNIHDFA